jgi:outer membrane protein OmpA-like peptidoglycan-associated protein
MPRLVGALLLLSTTAYAQQVDEFHPAVDSRGYLSLNGSSVLGHEELSFGLGSLEWGHHLSGQVDNVVSATLVAAMGLRLGPVPLELGASMPFVIAEGVTDTQGVGDAGLHLKVHVMPHIALIGSAYFPTGKGSSGVTPQALAVIDTKLGRWGFAANGGVRLSQGMDDMPTTTQIPLGVAAAYEIVPSKFELVGELYGALQPNDSKFHQLEALAGVKLYLAKNSYLSLGAGRGLVEESGSPDFRALIGIVFEPKAAMQSVTYVPEQDWTPPTPAVAKNDFPDRDNDGIRDDLDKCPDEPEDYNGFQDEDGCPDHPGDNDIVVDATPGCTKAGPVDGADCPNRVIVGETTIVTLGSIEFEFDKAVLTKHSLPILDSVAKALTENPDIQLVEVQGHTDERGDDAYNLDLSERRAAAVVTYLAQQGIKADRLMSQGYGETVPLIKEHNEKAWKANRRVEFHIRKRAGEIISE